MHITASVFINDDEPAEEKSEKGGSDHAPPYPISSVCQSE